MHSLLALLFALTMAHARPSCGARLLGGHLRRVSEGLARVRATLIDEFWAEEFQRRGWDFTPPGLNFTESQIDLGHGVFYLAKRSPVYFIATKCTLLGGAFFERPGVTPPTDALLTFVLAHEAGHHAQNLRGTLKGLTASGRADDQADCFAGAFFGWLWREGAIDATHVSDVKRRLHRDNPIFSPTEPAPGPSRKAWFMTGFYDGMRACERIAPL